MERVGVRSARTTLVMILSATTLLHGRTMSQGWLRTELIGPIPERITEVLPLSDQGNEGEWISIKPCGMNSRGRS